MNTAPVRLIVDRLPFWSKLSASEKTVVSERSVIKYFAKGDLVSSNGSAGLGIVFILGGEVGVSMTSEAASEITQDRA